MRIQITAAALLLAAHSTPVHATAEPGTLWDNTDFELGMTASGYTIDVDPDGFSFLPADDFFLDPALLEAAADPSRPDSCPEFHITEIRSRMFPRAEIAHRPWHLLVYSEDPAGGEPAPDGANAAIALTPAPTLGPVEHTTENTISESPAVVDVVWDFSSSPVTLPPGAWWLMIYKDTSDSQPVGWWSPSLGVTQGTVGQLAGASGPWSDLRDLDFDIDGEIVDPCAALTTQTIQGRSLRLRDRSEGTDPSAREIQVWARERESASTIDGDPTLDGATLELIVRGDDPSTQTFALPAEGWRDIPGTPGRWFQYHDTSGASGPVTRALIRRTSSGLFAIRARIKAGIEAHQTVEIAPPGDGTEAFAVLQIGSESRYCIMFGADGQIRDGGRRSFQIRNPVAKGCP